MGTDKTLIDVGEFLLCGVSFNGFDPYNIACAGCPDAPACKKVVDAIKRIEEISDKSLLPEYLVSGNSTIRAAASIRFGMLCL